MKTFMLRRTKVSCQVCSRSQLASHAHSRVDLCHHAKAPKIASERFTTLLRASRIGGNFIFFSNNDAMFAGVWKSLIVVPSLVGELSW